MLADPKSLHCDLGVQAWRAEDDDEGHILLQEDIVNLWKQGEDKMNWFEVVSYIEISNLQMRIINCRSSAKILIELGVMVSTSADFLL